MNLLVTGLILIIIFLLMIIFHIPLVWFFVALLGALSALLGLYVLAFRISLEAALTFIKMNVPAEVIDKWKKDDKIIKTLINNAADKVME